MICRLITMLHHFGVLFSANLVFLWVAFFNIGIFLGHIFSFGILEYLLVFNCWNKWYLLRSSLKWTKLYFNHSHQSHQYEVFYKRCIFFRSLRSRHLPPLEHPSYQFKCKQNSVEFCLYYFTQPLHLCTLNSNKFFHSYLSSFIGKFTNFKRKKSLVINP